MAYLSQIDINGITYDLKDAEARNTKVNTSDYAPDTRTSEMTQSVGKDSSGKLWTTPVSSASIVSATETWLANNITQETGYVIDDSLSTKGAAADAAATGNVKYAASELGVEKIQFKSGRIGNSYSSVYINNVQSASDWVYCVVPCKFGDKFIITGTAASTYRLYSFITDQASNNSLFNAAANLSVTDYVAVAPYGTKYIVVNARNTAAYSCIKYSYEYQKLKSDVSTHNEFLEAEKLLLSNRFRYTTSGDIGTTISLQLTASNTFDCGIYDCSKGDLFSFSGTGGDAGRLYAFIDSSNNLLMNSTSNLVADHLIVTAPENAVKIIICVSNTSEYEIYKGYSNPQKLKHEIENLETILYDITQNKVINFIPDKFLITSGNVGTTVNLSDIRSSSNGSRYAIIDVSEGDSFILFGQGGESGRLWCWIDSSNKIISRSGSNLVADGLIISAPENAAKLIVHTNNSNGNSYYNELLGIKVNDICKIINREGIEFKKFTYSASGGVSYDFNFTAGKTYKIYNESKSGTVNISTRNNDTTAESIVQGLEAGQSYTFIPSVNANIFRVYYNNNIDNHIFILYGEKYDNPKINKSCIAPILNSMTTNTALQTNDFRIVEDTLYRITTNIAANGTLTPGTNCIATTIGAEITALRNSK